MKYTMIREELQLPQQAQSHPPKLRSEISSSPRAPREADNSPGETTPGWETTVNHSETAHDVLATSGELHETPCAVTRQFAFVIYEYFRVTSALEAVLDYSDLFRITLHGDDVQDFDTRRDEVKEVSLYEFHQESCFNSFVSGLIISGSDLLIHASLQLVIVRLREMLINFLVVYCQYCFEMIRHTYAHHTQTFQNVVCGNTSESKRTVFKWKCLQFLPRRK